MKLSRLLLFLVVGGLAWTFSAQPSPFIYSREHIAGGEFWRLVTGHLVHFSTEHLVANLAAFAVLLVLAKRTSANERIWLGLACPILLGISLHLMRPELEAYGGLSGVLSAVFSFVAMQYAVGRGVIAWLFRSAILLFAVKLTIEFTFGATIVGNFGNGIVVEPAAHALGACMGLIPSLIKGQAARKQKGGPRRNRLTFFGAALHRPQINSLKAIRRNDRYSSVTSSNNSVKPNLGRFDKRNLLNVEPAAECSSS
jgi:rhomboid family GlyGly-CTERM serine protease